MPKMSQELRHEQENDPSKEKTTQRGNEVENLKKSKGVRLALCVIVKPTDDEAIVLRRCLENAAPHVDGIFLTVTGRNAACEQVAKDFNANLSWFPWTNHFANARNYALSKVPKEYTHWFWLDCDDVCRGVEKLKPTIAGHPEVDAFLMNYLYAFDEHKNPTVVHMKTRVLKHDGCAQWEGALHEDFKNNRKIEPFFIEGIDVLHLTDNARIEDSKKRNVEVAREDMKKSPDDPRSYWNLANSLKMDGKVQEALSTFHTFLSMSQSDEEKYIVHLRIAECYMSLDDTQMALAESRIAIGIRPAYPDAYHLTGHIFFQLKRYTEARDSFLQGLLKKPPYYSIIVYNPRMYDYEPLMALAKTYFQLSLPNMALECLKGCAKIYPKDDKLQSLITSIEKEAKVVDGAIKVISDLKDEKDNEKVAAALAALPDELKSHPAVCHFRNQRFIKTTTSGKDLVYFCGFTTEEWSPETAITKGIGGSEEAVIHLSEELVRLGWDVTVYNNCGHKELEFNGVKYKPFWSWNHRDKQDVAILWRHPRPLDYGVNAERIYLDLHDVLPAGEFNDERLKKISKVFVKSKAHRALFPNVPNDKFAVIPNGIVLEDLRTGEKRDPNLIINTSSPDRSLSALVDCFIEVKKQWPQAKCKWAYGWGVFDVNMADSQPAVAWKNDLMKKIEGVEGFEVLGRLGHKEIGKLYQQASVFAYPTAFYEIDCISARKAQAAGAVPVATNFAALDETVKYGTKTEVNPELENWGKPYAFDFALQDPETKKKWIDACVLTLRANNGLYDETWRKRMQSSMDQFNWGDTAKRWDALLKG